MRDVLENKIRVLHIIGSSRIGGAENMLLALVKHFDTRRFVTYIACPGHGELTKEYAMFAKKVFHLNFSNIFNLSTMFKLIGIMRRYDIDIVHTHLPTADFLGIISARFSGAKCVVSSLYGMNFLPLTYNGIRYVRKFILSKVYRIIYLMADEVLAVSNAVKNDLISRPGIRLKSENITVINNPGDTQDINLEAKQPMAYKYDIGLIANFYRIKGHEVFIRALALMKEQYPDLKAILLGHGDEENNIHRMISGFGLDDNIYFGDISLNTSEIIRTCRIVVLPSLNEGFPLVLIEAAFKGRPVVATRVGGIPEIIEDGVTGILIQPANPEKLAAAVVYLLRNPNIAEEMGKAAARHAIRRFLIENTVICTQQLYEEYCLCKNI